MSVASDHTPPPTLLFFLPILGPNTISKRTTLKGETFYNQLYHCMLIMGLRLHD